MSGYLGSGIHDDVPSERYHTDPCKTPSLSAGIAHQLLTRSPLHAREAHPRLNANHKEQEGGNLDFGTAAHALLLQGLDICQVIDGFDNFKKQAARDERDAARGSGLIPLLRKDYDRMCDLTEAVRRQLRALNMNPRPLADGKPEQTLIWREGETWCRARLDWLHESGLVIDDLKTTGTSANPYDWARNRLFADGKDVQCAHYLRGLRAITGANATWRFIVVEVEPPYALSLISLAPSALELAHRKEERALKLWKRCLETDSWPGYPAEVAYAELPAWEEARYLDMHYEPEGVAA